MLIGDGDKIDIDKKFWADKNVVVTGGHGFLGRHITKLLSETECQLRLPTKKDFDLRHQGKINTVIQDADIVIHLAANVGGIGYNQNHPYQLFYDNAIMGINLIDSAIKMGVKKFVQIGTVCSYPKWTKPPFTEKCLWDGYPEETNAPYGLAKKMLLAQLQAAKKEFGFNGIYIIPTNLYGPGDEFAMYRSHVIPALINKCFEAKKYDVGEIEVWGSGNATRDFLFVKDAAKGILMATEKYDHMFPLNMGSGNEVRIAWLVDQIRNITGYQGDIRWNTNKPDGQPRRCLNNDEIKYAIGWEAETTLIRGLRETIQWYEKELLYA